MKILIDGQALILPLALAVIALAYQIAQIPGLIGGEKDDESTEAEHTRRGHNRNQ